MSKFKVGDRVVVYGFDSCSVYWTGQQTEILKIDSPSGLVQVRDAVDAAEVHPKQCRRLKPRRPPAARWYVIDRYNNLLECSDEQTAHHIKNESDSKVPDYAPHRVVLMREVRRRSSK